MINFALLMSLFHSYIFFSIWAHSDGSEKQMVIINFYLPNPPAVVQLQGRIDV